MYKCKDCGKEYNEKVDYCDCGNNTFDYVEDFIPPKKPQKQPKQPLSIDNKSQIISWIFFAVCLVLSLIIWLIPIKVEQTVKEEVKKQNIDTKSIPNLEKIWNSTPPKIELKKEEKPQNMLDAIREELPDRIIPKPDVKKPLQNNALQPVQQPKPVVQNKQTQNKPVIQNKQTSQKPITQNKPAQQPKQSTTQPKQTSNPNSLKPAQQQTQQAPKPVETQPAKKTYNPNSPEMLKYKGSLRSALFAKLPVGSIQGSGFCSVQFAVDKTGKLINRAFAQQSDNKTLNDAVYYMLMSVPRFASPPEGYNQELIRMNINMNSDGSYEISIY